MYFYFMYFLEGIDASMCMQETDGQWSDRLTTTLLSLCFVLANTIVDSWAGAEPSAGTTEDNTKMVVGTLCLGVYTVERLLKMRIYGFFGSNGYFRSYWCILEFVVVIAGLVDVLLRLVTGNPSLPYVRALRVLVVFRLGKVFEVMDGFSSPDDARSCPEIARDMSCMNPDSCACTAPRLRQHAAHSLRAVYPAQRRGALLHTGFQSCLRRHRAHTLRQQGTDAVLLCTQLDLARGVGPSPPGS